MSFTITKTVINEPGKLRKIILKIVETNVGSADVWNTLAYLTPALMPRCGLLTYQSKLVSGSGTLLQNRFGKKAGWQDDTLDDMDGSANQAGYLKEDVPLRFAYEPGQAGVLHGGSQVNTGSNNVIHTLVTIQELP